MKFKKILPSLLITLLLLIVLEILSSTLLPIIGLTTYRLPFNILIILFLAFKLESPLLAIWILCIQYVHSFFSVEGWAMGVVAGIMVSVVVSYVKELLHFSTAIITMVVTQIFQMIWFVVVAALIYMLLGDWAYIVDKLWRFIPESIFISLLAPVFFSILDKIWRVGEGGILGEEF